MIALQETKPNIKLGQNNPISSNARLIDLACIVGLVILLSLTFGRTLESFFIADDFGEVRYVQKIFTGQPHLFWLNFVDNYMQIPSMAVWRPWLLATLVFDYAIWKGNAFGYYLTNLLYYAFNSILIYALLRRLTSTWTNWRSQATAFFTAALFTVSPLHCESVTWVVGRVDIACCFYYLLSFLLLLNNGRFQRLTATIATISFWLALWTKEMAIGLPVMVTASYLLLLPKALPNEHQPIDKLKYAFSKALPLWVSTIAYFPLRYVFLGTLTGGYTGSIGASQFAGIIKRWLDPDTLHRIIYPLNYSLFQNNSIYATILSAAYVVTGAILVSRLLNKQLSIKWTVFLLLWFATCAAPIYQLWGLGYDLEGSRFYYFLTLPLSLTLPLFLLQPGKDASSKKWPVLLSMATLAVLTFAYSKIAYATNMTWVHAGKEARAVFEESKKLLTGNASQFIVLGLPKRNSAAHIILNGDTYHLMLRPPFTTTSIDHRFNTFEPILFGPGEFINPSRFKTLVNRGAMPLVWSSKDKQFQKLSFADAQAASKPMPLLGHGEGTKWLPYHLGQGHFSTSADSIVIENPQSGDGLSFDKLAINPLDYDYLSFEFQAKDSQPLTFQANWHSQLSNGGTAFLTIAGSPNKYQTAYIPLSRYWRWFVHPTITNLNLLLPQTTEIKIRNVQLLPASLIAPQLKLPNASDTIGVYTFAQGVRLPFELVRSKLPGDCTDIQISKPNFFFENFADNEQTRAVDKTIALSKNKNNFVLDQSYFAKPGYYQIRAAQKNPTTFSDVVTIQRLP